VQERKSLQATLHGHVDQAFEVDLGRRVHHEDELPPLPENRGGGGTGRDHGHAVPFGDVGDGVGDRRRVGAEHGVDLPLRDEFLVNASRVGGGRLVIFDEKLDATPENAALFVRVLHAELDAAQLVLSERSVRARLGHSGAHA
jgi:hypothetical protein